MRMTHLPLGAMSEGTHDSRTLIEEMLYTFDHYLMDRSRQSITDVSGLRKEFRTNLALEAKDKSGVLAPEIAETYSEIYDGMTDVLDEYLSPFTYLGMHGGDGASFGVWIDVDAIESEDDEQMVVVNDLSETDNLPIECEWVLLRNDHGNLSLFAKHMNKNGTYHLRSLWSVV